MFLKRRVLNELSKLLATLNHDRAIIDGMGSPNASKWLDLASTAITEARRLISEEVN